MLADLSLLVRFIRVQVRSQVQYRVSFAFDVISMMLGLAFYFLSLVFVFNRFGSVGGWKLEEVAFLYGLVELSFGAMDMIFSGFDPDFFSLMVRRGSLDQLLLRPVSITLQVLGSRFIIRRLGRILEGLIFFVVACWLAKVQWTPAKLLYLPVVVASQILFFGGLFIIASTITFWTIERIEAMNILTYGGNEMISYPAHIYPGWLRNFFTFIIPAIFLNYYPALYFLNKPDPLGFPSFARFLAPFAGGMMLIVALGFWHFGLDHYQSTGS